MENKINNYLSEVLGIALKGMKEGGGPFGALIVYKGDKIAEAYNRVVLESDPTAHAEILAIRQAAAKLGTHNLGDCILFTSCEPCPMCLGAIYWSGIKKVYYALDRNDAAHAGFDDKFIYDEITLDPLKRNISFIKIDDSGSSEIFREWDSLENKIPYC